jgi:hypothetical protein
MFLFLSRVTARDRSALGLADDSRSPVASDAGRLAPGPDRVAAIGCTPDAALHAPAFAKRGMSLPGEFRRR